MAYKSKEQFPLIHNPKKKSFCHIDPRSGRVCSVHFHKGALKNAVAADPSWLQEQAWVSSSFEDEWSFEVGGYDMSTLQQDFGISFEEISKIQNYPPKRGVGATTDAANELFQVFNDRSNRKYMDKDVQVAVVSERIKAIEPEFRKLRDELDLERQNKEYPGNNSIGSEFPKSSKYYELIGKQREMFEERASLYQQAGYALGFENSSNELIKKAMSVSPDSCTTWQRADDGIERTYWNEPFSQLMSAVDYHARKELTVAKYNEQKKSYSGLADSKNRNIATHGTNDFENRIKPSPKLVEARVEFAIKEALYKRAQASFDSSNIFNRRSRKKALAEAKGKMATAGRIRDGRELE
jgi:hypothetical protein